MKIWTIVEKDHLTDPMPLVGDNARLYSFISEQYGGCVVARDIHGPAYRKIHWRDDLGADFVFMCFLTEVNQ